MYATLAFDIFIVGFHFSEYLSFQNTQVFMLSFYFTLIVLNEYLTFNVLCLIHIFNFFWYHFWIFLQISFALFYFYSDYCITLSLSPFLLLLLSLNNKIFHSPPAWCGITLNTRRSTATTIVKWLFLSPQGMNDDNGAAAVQILHLEAHLSSRGDLWCELWLHVQVCVKSWE